MDTLYDLIIIGGGPAGLAAALYAGRAKMKTLLFEGEKYGGQIALTTEVENYPGAAVNETGPGLVARMAEQAEHFGVELKLENVTEVDFASKDKKVTTAKGDYFAKTIIIATGANPRKLGVPGEADLTGKGVSYCATCDGAFFEDLPIYVIGGGDTAVDEAFFLSKFGRKVTIVHRRDELRAARSIQDKVFNTPNIEVMWDSVVEEIGGDGLVEKLVLKNVKTGELTEVNASEDDGTFGVFVLVGYIPANELLVDKITLDEQGYVPAGEDMKTDVPGVFVAGDLRAKKLRQVVTATSDGALAAIQAEAYVQHEY
jgi:thioredoxin reductase (NADPH)